MVIASYLNLFQRHQKIIVILLVLALIPAAYIGNREKPTTYDTTIFLSIAPENTTTESSVLEQTQAANLFTNTITGWFQNPSFTESFSRNEIDNLSVIQKENQNLQITFTSKEQDDAQKASVDIQQQLNAKISKYNNVSSNDFAVALFDSKTTPDTHSFTLYLLLGLILGLTMGAVSSYLAEYFHGVIIHRWQIENILNRKTDEIIRNRKVENYNLSYIMARIKDFHTKQISIVGLDFLPENLTKAVKESNPKLKITSMMFPDDAIALAEHDEPIIIVAKIGKSRLDNVYKISHLLKRDFLLITKE